MENNKRDHHHHHHSYDHDVATATFKVKIKDGNNNENYLEEGNPCTWDIEANATDFTIEWRNATGSYLTVDNSTPQKLVFGATNDTNWSLTASKLRYGTSTPAKYVEVDTSNQLILGSTGHTVTKV